MWVVGAHQSPTRVWVGFILINHPHIEGPYVRDRGGDTFESRSCGSRPFKKSEGKGECCRNESLSSQAMYQENPLRITQHRQFYSKILSGIPLHDFEMIQY